MMEDDDVLDEAPTDLWIRPTPPAAADVLNADEVAQLLCVDRKTVYDAAGRGHMPHRRLGKRLVFSRAALLDWLACLPASKGVTMAVRQRRGKQWFFRTTVRRPDGRRERIFGVPKTFGLPNTKVGAQEAERRAVAAALGPKAQPASTKEVPTIKEFSTHFMEVATAQNRPSSVDSKRVILDRHILPYLGEKRLDAVRYAEVQDLKLKLLGRGLGPKTVNNVTDGPSAHARDRAQA